MKRTLLVAIMLSLAVLLLTIKSRFILSGAQATALCHRSECVVVLGETYNGWQRSLLREGVGTLKNLIFVSDHRTHFAQQQHVFRIGEHGVQRFSFDGYIHPFQIHADRIYGGGSGGPWLWAGSRFRPATPIEKQELERAEQRQQTLYGDFSDREGWSLETLKLGHEFRYKIDGETISLVMQGEPEGRQRLELRHDDRPPEQLWSLDTTPRHVDAGTYMQIFHAR